MEKSLTKILIAGSLLLAACSYPITLQWNASNDSTVVGYKIYYGTSTSYTNVIDAGNVTNLFINNTNFIGGNTYYFVATAYDGSSNESNQSNIATYTPPSLLSANEITTNGNIAMSLTFPVYTSSVPNLNITFMILYSTNLVTWNTLYVVPSPTNNYSFNYIDVDTTNYPQKFYRLLTSTTQH